MDDILNPIEETQTALRESLERARELVIEYRWTVQEGSDPQFDPSDPL